MCVCTHSRICHLIKFDNFQCWDMKAHYDEKQCLVTNIILQGVVCLNFNHVNIKILILKIFLDIILVQNTNNLIGGEAILFQDWGIVFIVESSIL